MLLLRGVCKIGGDYEHVAKDGVVAVVVMVVVAVEGCSRVALELVVVTTTAVY